MPSRTKTTTQASTVAAATVAALAGDAPLLNPFPFASGGPLAHYETAGNGGAPMRNVFFLDDIDTFVRALRDSSTRHRAHTRTHHAAAASQLVRV